MTSTISTAAALALAFTLAAAVSSHAEPGTRSPAGAAAAATDGQGIAKADLRVRTDDYLVPAHVCPDAEAEKYEDCVPWSQIGENVVFVLPRTD